MEGANEVLQTFNRRFLFLVGRKDGGRSEQSPQRFSNPTILRASMGPDIVDGTQEFLQLLQGVDWWPILNGSDDFRIRGSPVSPNYLPHKFSLNLGQRKLRNPKTHGKHGGRVKGDSQRYQMIF